MQKYEIRSIAPHKLRKKAYLRHQNIHYNQNNHMAKNEQYMRQAIRLAVENVKNGGGPFGAVIVKDGEVIATGVNRVTATHDPTAHAEVSAIRAACSRLQDFQLEGCDIYTTCEPCPMCLGAIYWSRLRHIYYGCNKADAAQAGFDDSFIYKEIELPLDRRHTPIEALLPEEAAETFQAWNDQADKIEY